MPEARRKADRSLHSTNSWKSQPISAWTSNLVILDGTMNRHRYIQILGDHILPRGETDARSEFCLCKYNTAPHVALGTMEFLHQRDVEVTDWPAMGPDTNQIEHAWDYISIWIRDMDRPPSNLAELRQAVQQAWREVRWEGWGSWLRTYFVMCRLFLQLEGTHAPLIIALHRLLHDLAMYHVVWWSGF